MIPIRYIDEEDPSISPELAAKCAMTEAQVDLCLRLLLSDGSKPACRDVIRMHGHILSVGIGGWLAPDPIQPPPATARVLPFLQAPRRRGGWPGTYAEYVATPEFHRLAAMARREWKYECLLNRHHRGPVEVHHRTYARVPFGEDWRDLIPLCEDCHRLYHGRLPQAPAGLFDDAVAVAA